jgi:hypothetical protein
LTASSREFRAALKANDAAAVSGMALLPFQGDASVSNAVQFREKIYRPNFTKQNRACIRRETADYERDGENREISSFSATNSSSPSRRRHRDFFWRISASTTDDAVRVSIETRRPFPASINTYLEPHARPRPAAAAS